MFFSIFIIDKEDSAEQRVPAVEPHRQYIKDHAHKVLAAGATFADDGKTVRGGSYIVEMDSKEEVDHFVAQDPFTLAGIRQEVIVQPWIRACFNYEFLMAVTPPGTPDVEEPLAEPGSGHLIK